MLGCINPVFWMSILQITTYTRHCMSETSNYKLVVFDSETLRNDTFLVKLIIVQENYIPIE